MIVHRYRSVGGGNWFTDALVVFVVVALFAALAVTLLAGCQTALTRPDLYGTKYMREQWAQTCGPRSMTAWDAVEWCQAKVQALPIPSNYQHNGLVICGADGWHCEDFPFKITSDPQM